MDPLRRPVLLPGVRVLRRSEGEVQVGLDPRLALVLPADPAVARTLASLSVAGPATDADPAVLDRLIRAGLVVERAAATVRPTGRVELATFGAAALPEIDALLERSGLARIDPSGGTPADVGLLVGVGEPDRDLLDGWVRDGLPHLVARICEGTATVGPFVEPGRTACLRCVDAHRTDLDPRWPLLVAQQAAQSAHQRPDGVPDPLDPALVWLSLAWAVRDLVSHLGGSRPATWSTTLQLPPDLVDAESVSWLRHPECGCSWNQAVPGAGSAARSAHPPLQRRMAQGE